MRQGLVETVSSGTMSLVESTSKSNKRCLGTMYGPCADFKNPTRNSNFYSKPLWNNVFNNEYVKECLEDRAIIGELGHPQDRLETDLSNSCITMTDYEFRDDEGLVYGKFDILDTPKGQLLKSLLDYGVRIGVSSRGDGEVVTNEEGVNVVDEDDFNFIAFDAVILPAVRSAKPSLITESVKVDRANTVRAFTKIINESTNVNNLEVIRNVVESLNLPDTDSLLESVNNKSRELSGMTTDQPDNLIEDLESATTRINELSSEVSSLKDEIATCNSRIKNQKYLRHKLIQDNEVTESKYSKLLNAYKHKVMESSADAHSFHSLESELSAKDRVISKMEEELRTLRTANRNYSDKVNNLTEDLSTLRSELSSTRSDSKRYKNSVSELESSLIEAQKSYQELLSESSNRDSEYHSASDKVKSLSEELNRTRSLLKDSNAKLKSVIAGYAKSKCESLGVDYNRVSKSIDSNTTIESVDNLVESIQRESDRYRSLPITSDTLLNSIGNATLSINRSRNSSDKDDVSDGTYEFMSEASKLF